MPVAFDSVAIPIGPRRHGFRRALPHPGPVGRDQRAVRASLPRRESWRPRFSFNTPPAQRTVAQYATLARTPPWTSMPPGRHRACGRRAATAGTISGVMPGLRHPTVAGIAGAGERPPQWLRWLSTAPPDADRAAGSAQLRTSTATPTGRAAAAVSIDWNGIVNGNGPEPDLRADQHVGLAAPLTANWPIVVVDNPGTPVTLDAAHSGQGILIITGDATLARTSLGGRGSDRSAMHA